MIIKCIKDFAIKRNKNKLFLQDKNYLLDKIIIMDSGSNWYSIIAEGNIGWQVKESVFKEHFLSLEKYRKIKLQKIQC